VDLLEDALEEAGRRIRGSRIAVLGYAFLENSDDARNTPTVPLREELARRGATYIIHDPYIMEGGGYAIEGDIDRALRQCDAVVLMTKHEQYRSVTPERLSGLLNSSVVIDGRNMFDARVFADRGFIYKGVGKGNVNRIRQRPKEAISSQSGGNL